MRLRTTLALVVVAAIAGAVIIINPFSSDEPTVDRSPWFYQVSMDDITEIGVNHRGKEVDFYKTDAKTWSFVDPEGIPPNHTRWGGMTLLLSGPGTQRDLSVSAQTIDDPAQYGLDDPDTTVDVGLTANRSLQFRLGDKTTNGRHHYGQVVGFPQLFLISSSWGDVISRLATEPPLPLWYVKRPMDEIVEFNVYLDGDPTTKDTPVLRFKRNNDDVTWGVRDYTKDTEDFPVDEARFNEIIPLVHNAPDYITVDVPVVDDRDYSPWGITDDSRAVEVRFASRSETGVTYIDGVLLLVGKKSPDGKGYYAKNVEDSFSRQPVLLIDAEWVETMFGLWDDVPYARADTQ